MPLELECLGEAIGTFLLVFFGCGSVCAAVLTGAQVGVFQVAIVWGLGVAIAISLTGGMSGAHLNPAVTLVLAMFRAFPLRKIIPYWTSQMLGAFLASSLLYVLYSGEIKAYEEAHALVRGTPGSEASAMIFGEYFPNPAGRPLTEAAHRIMPMWRAFLVEVTGTAVLLLVVLGLTDDRNRSFPKILTAPAIGLTVTILISLFAPLTMACFNPARDLAPRLLSSLAGWGAIPFQVNGWGWCSVYVLAPLLGAVLGGCIYQATIARSFAHFESERVLRPET